ncbi:phage integrase [Pseudomonas aeruginosa]|uniref:phage integrase n=1 Tax=Pseudomonas aeruginosa TaxID=287 RepID=UPI00053D7B61|nr:tyrosine-type recombinase/integrase [Pseudomonas aeruginosa]MBV5701303.1 tyrosine-type recombinase/integrase [Pseudomonas aeruginosa]MBV5931000.1 tyrosine-type recombinase/integrase [Pseudomonas aeruginosa]MCV0208078.1 tyrosine-type recombinase/integrase [Pseudomonas aeruginosa]MDG3700228.1 tyrosine-type recombinase/integrase [Pseudomonas aeruginosa]MDP5879733.1 tyrosine-type recombinase/integrase [Pseudomonas aeruginosa]
MAITKLDDGRWLADIEPIKGKRFRKRFKTKGEAQRFEATVRSQTTQDPAWNPRPKDRRRLLELIARWKLLHGHALVDVERTDLVLRRMAESLGNPVAADLTGAQYTTYRARRLSSGVSGKTVNNQLGYLRSMFSVLRHLGEIDYADPLEKVRPLKLQERELSFLSKADIAKVFHSLKHHSRTPHVEMVATICLATGCRWGEAQGLVPERVKGGAVHFINTKSKRRRSVPIPPELEERIHDHFQEHGLFSNCRDSFDYAVKMSGVNLPPGQKTHVLRHTFASHYMMNGGNILTLQRVLGHASLNMTMRYAHLAPDHLLDVLTLGPIRDFRHFFDTDEEPSSRAEPRA